MSKSKDILVVEPLCARGHVNSNRYFISVLQAVCRPTLATTGRYHENFETARRVVLPEGPAGRNRVAQKLRQAARLTHVQRVARRRGFDRILFLCYDSIGLASFWRLRGRQYLFDHNNVDQALNGRAAMAFYRRLPRDSVHLVYMTYIGRMITALTGHGYAQVPHPHYLSLEDVAPAVDSGSPPPCAGRLRILMPSGANDSHDLSDALALALEQPDVTFVVKHQSAARETNVLVRPYFENYLEELRAADVVYMPGGYDYRVSGVVFEALSVGTPAAIRNCRFGRRMQKLWPNSVRVVSSLRDVTKLRFDRKSVIEERRSFLEGHDFDRISRSLIAGLGLK